MRQHNICVCMRARTHTKCYAVRVCNKLCYMRNTFVVLCTPYIIFITDGGYVHCAVRSGSFNYDSG